MAQTTEQTPETDQVIKLDTVTVTSTKREKNLSDVPLSVRVLTAEDLQRDDITRLDSLVSLVPGVAINAQGDPTASDISIRGIGDLGGIQNTYGIYVDGFETSTLNSNAIAQNLSDVESVEVLRGPQGTTFGRNVVAGAINIVTQTPGDEFGGNFEVGLESYNTYSARGAVNLPISDQAGVRLSSFYENTDGHIENVGPAGGSNDRESYGLRLVGEYRPTERLSIRGTIDYQDTDQGLVDTVSDGQLFGEPELLQQVIDAGLNPFFEPGTLPAGGNAYFPESNDTVSLNTDTFVKYEFLTANAKIEYDFDATTLVIVGGYIGTETNSQFDTDNTELDFSQENISTESSSFSSEIRLQSNGDEVLDWVVGAYYATGDTDSFFLVQTGNDTEAVSLLPGVVTGLPVDVPIIPNNSIIDGNRGEATSRSAAIFGDIDYEFTDRFSAQFGARYNADEYEFELFEGGSFDLLDNDFDVLLDAGCFTLLCPVEVPVEDFGFPLETSSDSLTWKVSGLYKLTDAINVYSTVATGYRAGGIEASDGGDDTDGTSGTNEFDPEELINYEAGLKGSFLDGRLTTNAAVFFMDYSEIQIVTTDISTGRTNTANAGAAEVFGVEFDAAAQLSDNFTLGANFAYLDTELTEYVDADGNDLSGTSLPNAPEFSATLTAEYAKRIAPDLEGFVRLAYVYNDEQFNNLDVVEESTNDDYNIVNLRLGFESVDDWRLEGFVENLFDETYSTGTEILETSLSGSLITTPPQRYGVRLFKTF